jgi:membrane-associated HD superfamily phosphohydrolase
MEGKNSWRKLKRTGTFKRKVNRDFLLLKRTTLTTAALVTDVEKEKCTIHEQQKGSVLIFILLLQNIVCDFFRYWICCLAVNVVLVNSFLIRKFW